MSLFHGSWITAVVAFVVSYVLLFLGKKVVAYRIKVFSKKTETKIDDLFAEILASIKTFFLIAVSFYVAVRFLRMNPYYVSMISKLVFVFVVLQVAITGNKTIRFLMENYILQKMTADASNAAIIGIAVFTTKFLLYIVLFLLVLNNFGVDVTALIAGLGVGGIAIALALQNILGDLFASFTIILDKPFLVGDFIVVGENMGNVEKIGIKTTRVRSISGEQLIFPNGQLLQGQIKNFKRMQERRIIFNLNVVYQISKEKIEKIPQIIEEIISAQKMARLERTHFKGYGDFALMFETVYWVKDPDFKVYMDVQQEINLQIFERFAKEGIDFAYPTQTIYGSVKNVQK